MKDVKNTTQRPLRVPLPGGGVLHLGPRKVGQVGANALEHPPFKKLVDSGDLEVLGEGAHEQAHPIKESVRTSKGAAQATTPGRSTGER